MSQLDFSKRLRPIEVREEVLGWRGGKTYCKRFSSFWVSNGEEDVTESVGRCGNLEAALFFHCSIFSQEFLLLLNAAAIQINIKTRPRNVMIPISCTANSKSKADQKSENSKEGTAGGVGRRCFGLSVQLDSHK